MNTKQLINGIIDLDNENKALRNMLNESNDHKTIEQKQYDDAKEDIFLIGLRATLNDYCNPFTCPEDIFNKDTGEFITFEAWIQGVTIDKYNRRYLPDKVQDNLSNKQILELYESYLKFRYELKLNAKQNELLNESNESCES